MQLLELKNRLRGTKFGAPLFRYVRARRLQRDVDALAGQSLPRSVIVELTNVCNLRCAKCPTYEVARGRGMMDRELFQKLLADIATAGGRTTMSINGGGEAVLHPEVVDFVRMAKAVPNIRHLSLTTNALALDPVLAEQLLEAGLDGFKVSLDVTDPAAYLKVNRVDGYETVVHNLLSLWRIKVKGEYRCAITMKVTLYKNDRDLVERIRTLWQEHVDHIKITGLHNWAGLRGARRAEPRNTPCPFLWEQVQVLWNGQLTLCCWDSMEGFFNMGNIRDVNLGHYWTQDAQLNGIRLAHLRNDYSALKVCATCNADTYYAQFVFHNPSRVSRRQQAWLQQLDSASESADRS